MSDEATGTQAESQAPTEGVPSEGTSTQSEQPVIQPAPETAGSDKPIMIPKPRFDEVNRRMHEAEAELAKYRNPQPQAEQPKGAPKQEDFTSYEEFIEARADYRAREAVKAEYANLKKAEQQQEFQRKAIDRISQADSNWQAKIAAAAAANPQILQTISAAPVAPTESAWLQIREADNCDKVAEFLSKNPQEMARINAMWPDQQAKEITRLDVKLAAASPGPQSKKPAASVPDLDPVGQGNHNTIKDVYNSKSSVSDYIAATRRLPG